MTLSRNTGTLGIPGRFAADVDIERFIPHHPGLRQHRQGDVGAVGVKPSCGFVPVQLALGHHNQQLVRSSVLQPVADLPGDLLRSRRAWGEHHNQVAGAIHRVGDPTLPHKLGLADNSVVSRNTRSAFSWPTRRAMRCNPF